MHLNGGKHRVASKDYAAIAAKAIRKPTDSKRMPRVLVYGRYKKGKTRFCTTAPNVLIVDPEEGTDWERKANPDTWQVTEWAQLNDVYMYLKTGKHPYRWVAFDGMTGIADIALRFIRSQDMERNLERKPSDVRIQDYGKSGKLIGDFLINLHSLRDIGFIFTAQERSIAVEELGDEPDDDATPSAMIYVPDLPNASRGAVTGLVDVVGRIYTVRGTFTRRYRVKGTERFIEKEEEGIQRRLWVGPHQSYDTGYRSEFTLPDMIADPTIPKLIKVMREGKE
jgi:hypothetical protein